MRKYLILIATALLLVACGDLEIHESVNEQAAEDALKVMDRIMYYIDKDIPIEDVKEEDHKLFERFTEKYIDESDVIPNNLDDIDKSINVLASSSLVKYAKGAALESDKKDIKDNYELMIDFIENGKDY